MHRCLFFALIVFAIFPRAGAAGISEETVSLTGGKMRVRFDLSKNGGITSLGYGDLEVVSPNCERPTIFSIGIPVGGGSRYFDNLDFTRFEHQAIENGFQFHYSGLPGTPIDVTLQVRGLADYLAFRATVRCEEKSIASDLMYPMINGYEALSGHPEVDLYLFPQLCGELYHNPAKVLRASRGPTFSHEGYPGSQGLQFHSLFNQHGGLVMYAADRACRPKMLGLFHDRVRDTVSWSIRHYFDEVPEFRFAADYDVRIQSCGSSWYDAADVYAAWSRQQWWMTKKVKRPGWLDAMPMHASVHDNEHWTEQTPSWIAAHQPEMNAILGNRPLIHQFHRWEHYGNWIAPDSFPPRGGEKAMLEAASAVRGWGGHLKHLFSCSRYWLHDGIAPEEFEKSIVPMAALPRGRHDRQALVREHEFIGEFVNACPGSLEYQARLVELVDKLADYQHDVISMDIWPVAQPVVCHNPHHGHPPGLGPWFVDANQALIEKLQSAVFAKQPNAVFGGEGMAEPYLPWMHLTLMRSVISPIERDRDREITYQRLPLFDYVYGDQIITWDGYATTAMHDCRPLLALQFVRGELLSVDDKWHPRFFDREAVRAYQAAHPAEPIKVFLRQGIQPGGQETRKRDLEFAAALNDVQRGPFNAYFSHGRCTRLPRGFVRDDRTGAWMPLEIYDRAPAVGALRHPQADKILWAIANGGNQISTVRLLPPENRSPSESTLPKSPRSVNFRDAQYLEIALEPLELGVIEWE